MTGSRELQIDADLRIAIGPATVYLRGEHPDLRADVARLRDLPVLWRHRRQLRALAALARRGGVQFRIRAGGWPLPRGFFVG